MRRLPNGLVLPTALLSILAAGCADAPAGVPDLASSDPCAPYGVTAAAGCSSALRYEAGPALPVARDHHATVIAETAQGAFLYVTGGTSYTGVFKDVQVARLAADGTPGAFAATTELPSGRAGHGVAVHSGRVFLVAGRANAFLKTAVSAAIHEDGTLGEWEPEPSLPAARFHLAVVASETHVYAIGGASTETGELPYLATADVYVAPFLPDGHLGPWQTLAPLPEPRSHHAVVLHEGRLYVVGGLVRDNADGAPMATDVLSAPVAPDGTVGGYAVAGQLEEPVSTMAMFAAQGALYLVGGLNESDEYVGRVRRSALLAGGAVGSFVDVEGLPVGRSHVHQTPYRKGRFYSMGGSTDYQVVTDALWVGSFSPPASLAGNSLLDATRPLSSAPRKRAGARCGCGKSRISVPR